MVYLVLKRLLHLHFRAWASKVQSHVLGLEDKCRHQAMFAAKGLQVMLLQLFNSAHVVTSCHIWCHHIAILLPHILATLYYVHLMDFPGIRGASARCARHLCKWEDSIGQL